MEISYFNFYLTQVQSLPCLVRHCSCWNCWFCWIYASSPKVTHWPPKFQIKLGNPEPPPTPPPYLGKFPKFYQLFLRLIISRGDRLLWLFGWYAATKSNLSIPYYAFAIKLPCCYAVAIRFLVAKPNKARIRMILVKVVILKCQSCGLDLLKSLHGFVSDKKNA